MMSKGSEAGSGGITSIKELVDNGLQEVPPLYIVPEHNRPTAPSVSEPDHNRGQYLHQIPVVDLADLIPIPPPDHGTVAQGRRSSVVEKIGRACEEWGFFQVINHGVDARIIQCLREGALAFFSQPAEERMKLHTETLRTAVGYSTSFIPSRDKVRDWRDTLRFFHLPGEFDGFQEAPDTCRKPLLEYIDGVERLAHLLYSTIFESMGLPDMAKAGVPTMSGASMVISFYPPCPDPRLALGINGHTDPKCLTILHPDFDVQGLEVCKDNSWVQVTPCQRDALVVNLGDQIEILANGKYKSIEHRVVTNSTKPRMSIATFFGPTNDTVIAPLSSLLNESNPALFKATKLDDYLKNTTASGLLGNRRALYFAKA